MMAGTKKTIKKAFVVMLIITFFAGIAQASTDIEYKKGTQIYQEPGVTGIKSVQFIAECDGVMAISGSDNRADILSSCKPRNLYIQFIVPNDKAVYQTKDKNGQKTAIRVLQKRVAVSGDGKYNILLTKLESVGRFEYIGDSINQDDNFIVENAADQTLKANIKMIDAETIMKTDRELYNSLNTTNLSYVDRMFFNRVKNTMEVIGLDNVFRNINNALRNIIGG